LRKVIIQIMMNKKPIGIYYEHPQAMNPLFAAFERLGVPYEKIKAQEYSYAPQEEEIPWGLVFNRLSANPFLEHKKKLIHYGANFLHHVESYGVPTINGLAAYTMDCNKARQFDLMRNMGINAPKTHFVHDTAQVLPIAEEMGYPVFWKPNVGGRGTGVQRFDTAEELEKSLTELDWGTDGVAMLQEYIPARDGVIYRLEVVGKKHLYTMRVPIPKDSFNLCLSEYCPIGKEEKQTAQDRNKVISLHDPAPQAIADVLAVLDACKIEIGSIEYMIDERTGERVYYDINALSCFASSATEMLGFDPHERVVEYVVEKLKKQ
jgi:hypothetical protein